MSKFESPITPSVGRVVLVRGTATQIGDPSRELPGLVTKVWSDSCINVTVLTDLADRPAVALTSVIYNDDPVDLSAWCAWRWMPYQVQTAAAKAA